MDIQELMELRHSNQAPFDHAEYTVWLHDKIVDKLRYELWQFRERESIKMKSPYAACTNIMALPSLKTIK